MRSDAFNTRKYLANTHLPYETYSTYYASWLFSTGMGNTSRYLGQMQVQVPLWGRSGKINAEVYALSNSDGSKYYGDTKGTIAYSTTNIDNAWIDISHFSQTRKKNVLSYGFYCKAVEGVNYIGDSRGDARIAVRSYQGVVHPTGSAFTSGTVARYNTYRLTWTTDAEDDFEQQNSTCQIVITDQDGNNGQTITLANGATSYDLDTTRWSSGSGIRWKVLVGAYGSGTVSESGTYYLSLADPTAKVDDLRPTSKTYYGFDAVFSWAFSGSVASGSISGPLTQASAVLQYRTDNMANPAQFAAVSGSVTNVTVNCGILPTGSYQWRVVATSNVGTTHASSWQTCTNTVVPISVQGTTPAAGGNAPRAIINRFSWVFSVTSDDRPGEVTQRSAVLYYKTDKDSDWHSQTVDGDQQYCDIPANTFADGSTTLDWYVVATATTGTSATSETITVSTKDARSSPVAVSPAGEYLDDSVQGITFAWIHANITGTPQTGWEVSYSTDSGASYVVLAQGDGTASSYQADAGTFDSGVIYWRVRTKNTDGELGNYSDAAIFAIRRAPVAPVISYYDNKPRPTMRWQAKEQSSYEITVDGVSLGVQYGTGKEWQSGDVLADGVHLLAVRIYNAYGDVSDWAECRINIKNKPGAAMGVKAKSQWGQVLITWGGDGTVYILRDGELIAKSDSGSYTDRTSAAEHAYTVRVFDADGYYTDSEPVSSRPRVPYAAIGLRDGADWLALKYAQTNQNYSRTVALNGTLRQYWGSIKPVWHDAGSYTVGHQIAYVCRTDAELAALRALAGQEIVYKDRLGHLAIGVYTELAVSRLYCGAAVSLTINETEQKAVNYDTV